MAATSGLADKEIRMIKFLKKGLFGGILGQEVLCHHCEHRSFSEQSFSDLSLDFPPGTLKSQHSFAELNVDERVGRERQSDPLFHLETGLLASEELSLSSLLARYTDPEEFDGKVYHCDECSRADRSHGSSEILYRQATKQVRLACLTTTPLSFILTLTMYASGTASQATGHLAYSSETISLAGCQTCQTTRSRQFPF